MVFLQSGEYGMLFLFLIIQFYVYNVFVYLDNTTLVKSILLYTKWNNNPFRYKMFTLLIYW